MPYPQYLWHVPCLILVPVPGGQPRSAAACGGLRRRPVLCELQSAACGQRVHFTCIHPRQKGNYGNCSPIAPPGQFASRDKVHKYDAKNQKPAPSCALLSPKFWYFPVQQERKEQAEQEQLQAKRQLPPGFSALTPVSLCSSPYGKSGTGLFHDARK